jgi:hypothetical protein
LNLFNNKYPTQNSVESTINFKTIKSTGIMVKKGTCCRTGKDCCGGLKWVLCDRCDENVLYENCGMEGEYDEAKVHLHKFVCRMCKSEEGKSELAEKLKACEERLMLFSERLPILDAGLVRVTEESKNVVKDECVKVDVRLNEVSARMVVLDDTMTMIGDKIVKVETRQGIVEGSVADIVVKQSEFEELMEERTYATVVSRKSMKAGSGSDVRGTVTENTRVGAVSGRGRAGTVLDKISTEPVVGTSKVSVGSAGNGDNTSSVPGSGNMMGRKNGMVVLLGSSMARGIGCRLEREDERFRTQSYGGARIEQISWKLRQGMVRVLDDSGTHLVVMVGTNNLATDDSELILSKYGDLIKAMSEVDCRERSIVGILTRADEDNSMRRKRNVVNYGLEQLCVNNGIHFIDPWKMYVEINGNSAYRHEVTAIRLLDRGGLHLNGWGQVEISKKIFDHCKSYLN